MNASNLFENNKSTKIYLKFPIFSKVKVADRKRGGERNTKEAINHEDMVKPIKHYQIGKHIATITRIVITRLAISTSVLGTPRP